MFSKQLDKSALNKDLYPVRDLFDKPKRSSALDKGGGKRSFSKTIIQKETISKNEDNIWN